MIKSLTNSIHIRKSQVVGLLVISILYAALSIVADGFRNGGKLQAIMEYYESAGTMLILACFTMAFGFILGIILFSIWNNAKTTTKNAYEKISARHFTILAIILFLAWVPWIISHYPGTVRDDTIPQLFQWYGEYPYYTQHPVMDTLIFGVFFSLGDLIGSRTAGLFVYILIQNLFAACLFSGMLCYMWKHCVPRSIVYIAAVFFAFSRVIYQPLDAMSKDSINSLIFCALIFGFIEIVRSCNSVLSSRMFSISYFIGVILCIGTKRTMLYVLLIVFISYLIYLINKKTSVKFYLAVTIVPAVLGSILVIPLINRVVDANENETYEMYSVPNQQIVRTIISHPDSITEDELERLSEYIDIERACEEYNYWRSDEVSSCVRDSSKLFSCLDIWIRLGLKHPDTYFAAWLGISANWFSLTNPISFGHDSGIEYFDEGHIEMWRGFFDSSEEADAFLSTLNFQRLDFFEPLHNLLEMIDSAQAKFYAISSYGLYASLLPIILMSYAIMSKNIHLVITSVVSFALLASFVLGPIALYWYAIPAVFITPLMLSLPFLFPSRMTYRNNQHE